MDDYYITKEQAIELLHYNSDEKCAAIIADVEELEPADVAPVVRGEWLNGKTFLENAVCSNCKTTYEAYYSKYQYCPRCGARMGGEDL